MKARIMKLGVVGLMGVMLAVYSGCISGPFRSATVGQQRSATVRWTEDAPWWAVPFTGTAGVITDAALLPLDTVTVLGTNTASVVFSPITNGVIYPVWVSERGDFKDESTGFKAFMSAILVPMSPFCALFCYPCSIAEMCVAWDYWDGIWGNKIESDIEDALAQNAFDKARRLVLEGHGTLALEKPLFITWDGLLELPMDEFSKGTYTLFGVYDGLSDEAWRAKWLGKVANARTRYVNTQVWRFVQSRFCLTLEEYKQEVNDYQADDDIEAPVMEEIREHILRNMDTWLAQRQREFRTDTYAHMCQIGSEAILDVLEEREVNVTKVGENDAVDCNWRSFAQTYMNLQALARAILDKDDERIAHCLSQEKGDTNFPVLPMDYSLFSTLPEESIARVLTQSSETRWVSVDYPEAFAAYTEKIVEVALQTNVCPWATPLSLADIERLPLNLAEQCFQRGMVSLDASKALDAVIIKGDDESVKALHQLGEQWNDALEQKCLSLAIPYYRERALVSNGMFDYLITHCTSDMSPLMMELAMTAGEDAGRRCELIIQHHPSAISPENFTPMEVLDLLIEYEGNASGEALCPHLRNIFLSCNIYDGEWNSLMLQDFIKACCVDTKRMEALKALLIQIKTNTQGDLSANALWDALSVTHFIRDEAFPNAELAKLTIELGILSAKHPIIDGVSPLVYAVKSGNATLLEMLREADAINLKRYEENGKTLIAYAIDDNDINMLSVLVDKYSMSLSKPCVKGKKYNALAYAKSLPASDKMISYLRSQVGVLDMFAGITFGKTYESESWLGGRSYPAKIELAKPFRGIKRAELLRTPTTHRVYAVKLKKSIRSDADNYKQAERLLFAEYEAICAAIRMRYKNNTVKEDSDDLGIISEHHKCHFYVNDELHIEVEIDNGLLTSGHGDVILTASYIPLREEAIQEQYGNANDDAGAL